MEEIMNYFKNKKMLIFIFSLIILGSLLGFFVFHHEQPIKNEIKTETKVRKVKEDNKTSTKILVVDVQGAVKKPGVYRLKDNDIVQDAIKMAGGLVENSDVKQINQAKKLTDQMQIYVPLLGDKNQIASSNNLNTNKVVNINTASVDDFKNVTGIGPKKAEKIIAFREKNGNFKELHDLTKVSGIGEKSLESLKDQLTV